jgi:putative transposase
VRIGFSRRARDLEKSRGLVRAGDDLEPAEAFGFIKANQAVHGVATMGRMLGVSSSGYYAWRRRTSSARARRDAALLERIRTIHAKSRGTYGVPRVHAELAAEGERVGRKRVARLMREAGLEGASRRKGCWTTRRDPNARPAPDLVQRAFAAEGPNQLWVADITYIPTWAGFLYLAVVLDAWSRRVVGWAMANHLRTELVLEALDMAVWRRRPGNVIHHCDQGCQYTLIAFGSRCRQAGVRPSMGRSAIASTTRCASRSSPRWNANCSIRVGFTPTWRRARRSSISSRGGTTRIVVTRRWTTTRRSVTKGSTNRHSQGRYRKSTSQDALRAPISDRHDSQVGG